MLDTALLAVLEKPALVLCSSLSEVEVGMWWPVIWGLAAYFDAGVGGVMSLPHACVRAYSMCEGHVLQLALWSNPCAGGRACGSAWGAKAFRCAHLSVRLTSGRGGLRCGFPEFSSRTSCASLLCLRLTHCFSRSCSVLALDTMPVVVL